MINDVFINIIHEYLVQEDKENSMRSAYVSIFNNKKHIRCFI